jgi:uncharacterized YigZ family protein
MPGQDSYKSIAVKSAGVYRDRGSKFLAFAYPVYSKEEVSSILADLKKEYHDARHYCYAYRLGASKLIYRANDDGEPSNSAGKPIFGQIQAADLSNILIVVVRYFGGTLLGVGGLIKAYRSAAADALANASIIEKTEADTIIIHFPYEATNDIMKILEEENLKPGKQEYMETCLMETLVPKSRMRILLERINKIQGVHADKK